MTVLEGRAVLRCPRGCTGDKRRPSGVRRHSAAVALRDEVAELLEVFLRGAVVPDLYRDAVSARGVEHLPSVEAARSGVRSVVAVRSDDRSSEVDVPVGARVVGEHDSSLRGRMASEWLPRGPE